MNLNINEPFEFACDKECRDLSDNSTCKKSDRDPKKIALMYHFKTKAPESKRFTFIKLETHRNADLNHFVSAISTYALGIDGNPSDYISRRESCKDKCIFSRDLECDENDMCYMPSFRNQYHIQNYLNKMKNDANFEEIKNELYKNLNYYNLNLRTGDELYIPQVITDQLLKILF